MSVVSADFIKNYRDILKKNNTPYTLYINNASQKIISETGTTYFSGEELELEHRFFIRAVKIEVENRIYSGLIEVKRPIRNIVYFDISSINKKTIRDAVEIDLDMAYWETAYQIKVISRDTYRMGLKVPKKVRLMALGSLGKKTEVFYFDGKKINHLKPIYNAKTDYVWTKICKHVSDIMNTITSNINHEDFLFYWVDAVFVRKGSESHVKEMIKNAGYKFKTKEVGVINFNSKEILVDKKPFSLPKNIK